MTKCEGTTKEQVMMNRERREALVKDKRVVEQYECDDGIGVVLLDYNYAVHHVRHRLNSMKIWFICICKG